jgi:tripartite-type tricarboxylate transporter receptor subunit TctC
MVDPQAVERLVNRGLANLLFTFDLPITMAPAVLRAVPYKTAQDLAPVAMVGVTSNALFVPGSLGVGSVRELVDRARAQPGKLTYALAGNGSPAHFAAELFRDPTKVDIVHVPYKGAAQAVTDVVSGTVSMMFGPVGQALPHAKKGSVKVLAVTGPRRSPLLPEAAALTELGYPGVSFATWYGVFAPARTPASALARIERDLRAAVDAPEVRQKLGGIGIEPAWQGPAEFAGSIQADAARWAKVAAAAKITAD